MMTMTNVWVVISDDCVDDIYAFARDEDAEAYRAAYDGDMGVYSLDVIGADEAAGMIAERRHAVEEHDEECEAAGSGDHIVGAGCSL